MRDPSPDNQQEPDYRRTRRNVVAMGGIIASALVASSFAAKKANAGQGGGDDHRSMRHRHRGGDNHRGWWSFGDGDSHGWGPGGGKQGGSGQCFLSGTHVRTDVGEIAIENLRAGDMVPTVSGQARAIRRIHSWEAEREPNQDWTHDLAPIKVCRSALALNVPHRDLYLSPGHALYLGGVLISVSVLLNGRSIVRCSTYEADRLSYFHLEFEDHQVIFAEGTPVESLRDERMIPFAPTWHGGRRSELRSRLRSAISPWLDRRRNFDKVRDRLEARAESDLAGPL